jgi:hypothetical protein
MGQIGVIDVRMNNDGLYEVVRQDHLRTLWAAKQLGWSTVIVRINPWSEAAIEAAAAEKVEREERCARRQAEREEYRRAKRAQIAAAQAP